MQPRNESRARVFPRAAQAQQTTCPPQPAPPPATPTV